MNAVDDQDRYLGYKDYVWVFINSKNASDISTSKFHNQTERLSYFINLNQKCTGMHNWSIVQVIPGMTQNSGKQITRRCNLVQIQTQHLKTLSLQPQIKVASMLTHSSCMSCHIVGMANRKGELKVFPESRIVI